LQVKQANRPPLSSLDEHVEGDSCLPLFLDVVFGDFALTVDNKVSAEETVNSQQHSWYMLQSYYTEITWVHNARCSRIHLT